ncbi:hypothetical protein B0H19DRAFT_1245786 [Mycena capillaripes]|nr:hypothetical protein B0H19DRAFT_1245786 [Mycena capillaripes]
MEECVLAPAGVWCSRRFLRVSDFAEESATRRTTRHVSSLARGGYLTPELLYAPGGLMGPTSGTAPTRAGANDGGRACAASSAGAISRADEAYIAQAYSAAEIRTFTEEVFTSTPVAITDEPSPWPGADDNEIGLESVSDPEVKEEEERGRMTAIECLARRLYLVARRSLDVLPHPPTPQL